MKTIEYRTKDKSSWGSGPWQDEPDKVQWRDEATGLPCLIVRNRMGAWCGYAGVSREHPLFGKNDEEYVLNCHGGITFAGHCRPDAEEDGICHLVEPGEDDNVWWLGFDCAHAWDLSPGLAAREEQMGFPRDPTDIYRDMAYVQDQVRQLAQQLKEWPC